MLVLAKDQVWEQIFDQVARTVDGMGRRIDMGIMGTVLALNASGIRTTQSCEGHLDHGYPYPWVWVPLQDQDQLVDTLASFYQRHEQTNDKRLIINPDLVEDECVLQSVGANYQYEREHTLRSEKLREYQQEMMDFALFLKGRFFDE